MKMRLRANQNKLKIEHSIIDGLRPALDRLVESDAVRLIVPGVIKTVRDARGPVKIRVTVPVQNGWKAIALSAGSRQELFISTAAPQAEVERLIAEALQE
jgi:hypothetical protein